MFNRIKLSTIILTSLLLSCLLVYTVQAENLKASSWQVENVTTAVEIKAEKIQLPEEVNASGAIKFEQGQELAIPALNKGGHTSPPPLDRGESPKGDKGGFSKSGIKPNLGSNYKGDSVANTSGKIMPVEVKDTKQMTMKSVRNLGKPQGEIARAQSVKDVVIHSDSNELKRLEEKRLKRKANLKKILENSEVRRALMNKQMSKEKK